MKLESVYYTIVSNSGEWPLSTNWMLLVQQKASQLTRDDAVGAGIFTTSLSTPTQPQTEDAQCKPQSTANCADHRADEPRLLHHSKLHATHRVWTCNHITFKDIQCWWHNVKRIGDFQGLHHSYIVLVTSYTEDTTAYRAYINFNAVPATYQHTLPGTVITANLLRSCYQEQFEKFTHWLTTSFTYNHKWLICC